jgi:hypothetical protein
VLVTKRARHYRHWTHREDGKLRMLWGSMSVAEVAVQLKRSAVTVYWRARKLGLPCGCPQGMEYLTAAAERCGLSTGQLREVLHAAGVRLRVTMSRPEGGVKRHYHCVDPIDVDDAVAAWTKEETPEDAAASRGVSGETVRRALLAAGHAPPPAKKRWRVAGAASIAALAAYRPGLSVRAHAQRVGVTPITLSRRLRKAGLLGEKRPGVEVRLPVEVVDLVAKPRRCA